MQMLRQSSTSRRRRVRFAVSIAALVGAAILLLWLGQPIAAALMPLVGLLLAEIERRDQRAQALARGIATGQTGQKIEVRSGEWGDLSRAVNGLLQERRVQQRLRAAQPDSLPPEGIKAFLGGSLPMAGQARMVAILLVRHTGRPLEWEERGRRATLLAWKTLAHATHDIAHRHGALLQPCGDAILLAFGTFDDRPAAASLRDALQAAETLGQGWRAGGLNAGGPLVFSLVCGHALVVALAGLGYCVLGSPVEQAVRLQQLALNARRYGLLCNEDAYHALRSGAGDSWRPTELRIPSLHRPPQVVYEQET